jgi:hypothetical protein
MGNNFLKTLELANGTYFCWLQDDDLLFPDFATKAVSALEREAAAAYLAFAVCSPTTQCLHRSLLLGPPFRLDWTNGTCRLLHGSVIAPLSLFLSVAIPPTIAFRTEVLRRHQGYWTDLRIPLFVERTLLAAVGSDSNIVAAPHIAGVFRRHDSQFSEIELHRNGQYRPQWTVMASVLDGIAQESNRQCAEVLSDTVLGLPRDLLADWVRQSIDWPMDNKLCSSVRQMLVGLSASVMGDWPDGERQRNITKSSAEGYSPYKSVLRSLTPPLLWGVARRSMHALRRCFPSSD